MLRPFIGVGKSFECLKHTFAHEKNASGAMAYALDIDFGRAADKSRRLDTDNLSRQLKVSEESCAR
jgi:hypothetical protein